MEVNLDEYVIKDVGDLPKPDFEFEKIYERYLFNTRGRGGHRKKRIGSYYSSTIGNCFRKEFLNFYRKTSLSLRSQKVFHGGDLFQDHFVDEVLHWQYGDKHVAERSFTLLLEDGDDRVFIRGRVDGMVYMKEKTQDVPIEIKSQYGYLSKKSKPSWWHVFQLYTYMMAFGSDHGYFIYGERAFNPSEYAPYVTKTFRVDFEESKWSELKARVWYLHRCLKNNVLPVAEGRQNKEIKRLCKYCQHRTICEFCPSENEIELDKDVEGFINAIDLTYHEYKIGLQKEEARDMSIDEVLSLYRKGRRVKPINPEARLEQLE